MKAWVAGPPEVATKKSVPASSVLSVWGHHPVTLWAEPLPTEVESDLLDVTVTPHPAVR